MSNTVTKNTQAVANSVDLLETTSLVSLPNDAFAKAQAGLAFADEAKGTKLVGQAQQRMVYAIRIHDANIRLGKTNMPALVSFLARGADGKATAESNMVRDEFVKALAGDKPDVKDMIDNDKLAATKAYIAKTALVKFSLEVAAYCEKHGTVWSDFNAKTNCLIVPAAMLMPRGAKGNGRMAPDTSTGVILPPSMIELNGRSVSYSENTKDGEKTRNKLATVAHMLSCVRPTKAKRVPGGAVSQNQDATKVFDPKKPEHVAQTVDYDALIGALHLKLCEKGIGDKSAPTLVQADWSNKTWRMWSDICLTIDTASKRPGFKTTPSDLATKAA
jgi:hypothetical protein